MRLIGLLAGLGIGLLLLAGGLVWIFAEPYVIAAILIWVAWQMYKKGTKNNNRNEKDGGDGA